MKRTIPLALIVALLLTAATPSTTPDNPLSPMQKLFVLKEVKPDVQRVGILWNPDAVNVAALTRLLQVAGTSTQIEVFIGEAKKVKDVAPRWRELTETHAIDVLWVLENDGLMEQDAVQSYLLKQATKARIPVLAPDSDWVQAGATLALAADAGAIQLHVNKASQSALGLEIPEKYAGQVQYASK